MGTRKGGGREKEKKEKEKEGGRRKEVTDREPLRLVAC